MSDKAHIAELLRGHDRVQCIDKKTFEVQLKTPVTLTLKKDGIHTSLGRVIPYAESVSYISGLLGERKGQVKWDRNEQRRSTTALAKLYAHRVVKKRDTSFDIDSKKNPSTVHVSKNGSVRIVWSRTDKSKENRPENVYDYEDCIKHMTEYGPEPIPNEEMTAFATAEEIEKNPALMKRYLGPQNPQPHTTDLDAVRVARNAKEPIMSTEKQFWHHEATAIVFTTKAGTDVAEIQEQCTEIDKKQYKKLIKKGKATENDKPPTFTIDEKPAKKGKGKKPKSDKPRTPRGKGLGVGGKALEGKDLKAAQSAIDKLTTQGKKIRALIVDHDADNATIMEMLDLPDDKPVQRTRRAILREAKAKDE